MSFEFKFGRKCSDSEFTYQRLSFFDAFCKGDRENYGNGIADYERQGVLFDDLPRRAELIKLKQHDQSAVDYLGYYADKHREKK